MKAIAIIPGTPDVKLVDRPEPSITLPDHIKIKIIEVGICGTDREEASGGRADAPAGSKELVIGHEMFGQIVEVGNKVSKVKVGDYGVFTVRRGCGKCAPCNNNRSDMCYTGEYKERGIKAMDGYEAEYVVDSEKYLVKVPEQIKNIGVLTEPMSVAVKAIIEAERIQESRFPSGENWLKGKKTLVTGLGPIGLMAVFFLKLKGADVIGMDIVDEDSLRPQILKSVGGKYMDGRKIDPLNIDDQYGQIDLIFEGTGVAELGFKLIDALGINAIYVLSGIPSGVRPLSIIGAELLQQMVLNNQIIVGAVNAGIEHYQIAVQALEDSRNKWGNVIDSVITTRAPYTEFENHLHNHSKDEIKTVLKWS